MNNIVVVGGGTAGWLTALTARYFLPNDNITVIESKEIGIIGAGEGATPHLINFLKMLRIDIADLIKNTSTTIKNGIKFVNFDQDQSYIFSFNRLNQEFIEYLPANDRKEMSYHSHLPLYYLFSIMNESRYSDYDLIANYSNKNYVPFVLTGEDKTKSHSYTTTNDYSIHFDGNGFAPYLEKIGIDRNISTIDAIVKDVELDEDGYISAIVLDNGHKVSSDFVFDCTGFKRLIIGKFLKSKWRSFAKNLPAKRAIPFFLDIDKENIPPYTESTAMDYGWMWKIPLQHRYGCGYVFDSDFITEDQAKEEMERFLGHEIDVPRSIPFEAGVFEETFIKNCVAVGLSASFVEPLEATSIMQSLAALDGSLTMISDERIGLRPNKKYIDMYNKQFLDSTQEIIDFVYMHYLTRKTNTEFWKNFQQNNEMTDTLKIKMENIINSKSPLSNSYFFLPNGHYRILIGNDYITDEKILEWYNSNNMNKHMENFLLFKQSKRELYSRVVKHTDLLRDLGN